MKKTVFLSCGDLSGDRWASYIVRLFRDRFPEVRVVALGGQESEKAGALLLEDVVSSSTVGLWEVVRNLGFWRSVWEKAKSFLVAERPSVFLAIDNPGLNIRLGYLSSSLRIPVVYFAPPQVWAWGQRRGKQVSSFSDHVLCLFPWERVYFEGGKARVEWVGHPLKICMKGKIPPHVSSPRVILLLPGSRKHEVLAFLPVLQDFFKRYGSRFLDYRFVLVAASPSLYSFFATCLGSLPVRVVPWEELYPLLGEATFAISSSGTVALEVALGGVPQVIVYRTSWPTFIFASLLFQGSFIGLPNIILGQKVAPELLQRRFNARELYRVMENSLSDPLSLAKARERAEEISRRLGDGRTFERVVEVVAHYLA
jgi:lipid-A-disaccharide synthase